MSIISKDISEGVEIILKPEWSTGFDPCSWLYWLGNWGCLTRVDNHIIFISIDRRTFSENSFSWLEIPQKPLVPVFESIVRLLRITLVNWIVYFFLCFGGKPSMRIFIVHVGKRGIRKYHFSIIIKDIL